MKLDDENVELLKINNSDTKNQVIEILKNDEMLNSQIALAEEQIKDIQDQIKQKREVLLELMSKYDVKSIKNDLFTYTRVNESIRTTVDSKKLKELYPNIYDEVKKETTVKASLRITKRKEK